MNRLEESQSKDPFIHSIHFGGDGLEIAYENERDMKPKTQKRNVITFLVEGDENHENLYGDLLDLARACLSEAETVHRLSE